MLVTLQFREYKKGAGWVEDMFSQVLRPSVEFPLEERFSVLATESFNFGLHRSVKAAVSVTGDRPQEWGGLYEFPLDLTRPRQEVEQRILRAIEQGVDDAQKRADGYRRHQLIEEATASCLGGKYNDDWRKEDSRYTSTCGGREVYRWEIREASKLLLLFHSHCGVMRGMDGTNTPFACIEAIRFEELPKGNVFERLSTLDFDYIEK